MIQIESISKTYRKRREDVRALDDVSFSVDEGEFLVVRGPSGSGKSTLLLTIAGMVRPTSGRVLIRDQDIYALSLRERAQFRAQNVGFVFQMFYLVPYLNVLQNVLVPTGLAPPKDARSRAAELLDQLGMKDRFFHKPAELSTGERQRVAIARAMVNRPWLVFADEPTGNLDPENGHQVIDRLAAFNREGGTVILVTHEEWIERYASRVIAIRNGKLNERGDESKT